MLRRIAAQVWLLLGVAACSDFTLDTVTDDIDRRYVAVAHLAPADLPADAALIDVRTRAEFDVSRLPGAIWLPADAEDAALRETLDNVPDGADIVFYCSVGERSSRMAARALSMTEAGALPVYNLRGGLFAWHNEGRVLVDAGGGTTRAIHPYDKRWGRLIDDRSAIVTSRAD